MTKFDTKAGWLGATALACVLGLCLVAVGAETEGKVTKASPTKAANKKKAAKVEATEESAATPTHVLDDRPKKVVVKPTMTSAELDALVDSFLATTKAPPASPTTDIEFVRRIYLDVTGKLPTPEQTRAFIITREKDKRAKLIEHLLNSKEYAANWGRYWRDVIKYRATNEQVSRLGPGKMEEWLTEQIAKNEPWDKVAHDLITATGRTDENGAVNFALSHETQPVEVAGEVSRIFLGVQIQCAQCHDHPSDQWKRQQFHEFAAFFAGAKQKRASQQPLVMEIVEQGNGRYTMPDLKNPQTQIPVAPKFFLASETRSLPNSLSAAERHELAASYVTGQDNPWFAKAFVNRIWYTLTGDAFYSPVDDMGPTRADNAKAPEILNALADQWQKGGYDVRWLFRTILNSRTYQREVRSTFSASGRTPLAANCPSRLRADQILDSLDQALNLHVNNPGNGAGGAAAKKAAQKNGLAADLKGVAAKKKGGGGGGPAGLRGNFNTLFGVDPSTPGEDVLGTIPQSLFLMNSPQINRAIEAHPGSILGEILMATTNNRQALDALYLRIFAREPTAKEVQTCGRYLEMVGNRKEAFEDILWSLINSTEFITRR